MRRIESREQFLKELEKELNRRGINDCSEILIDFEQHFSYGRENGKSEAEVCLSLGDVKEIAAQYTPEKTVETPSVLTLEEVVEIPVPQDPIRLESDNYDTAREMEDIINSAPAYEQPPKVSEQTTDSAHEPPPSYKQTSEPQGFQNGGIKADVSGLVVCLIVDFLILSWALPSLFSVLFVIISSVIGIFFTGIGMLFGSVFNIPGFLSHPFSAMTGIFGGIALTSLGALGVLLSIKLIKWFIKIIKVIVNWHGKKIAGKVIFSEKGEDFCRREVDA